MSSSGKIIAAAGTQLEQSYIDALIASLPPIYQKEDSTTILHRLYSSLAKQLVKSDIILESIAHNNYLSVPITSELKIRGSEDRDRLAFENAHTLDKISLTPSNSIITQNTYLKKGTNLIQLYFIPQDIDFLIFSTGDSTQTSVNFLTSFDSSSNILTIQATREGSFTIGYKDTGNVARLNENVNIPEGLFDLGFGEGDWNQLGYGE